MLGFSAWPSVYFVPLYCTDCLFVLTVLGRAFKLFLYDVSSAPVSVHLPVSRFLAGQLYIIFYS